MIKETIHNILHLVTGSTPPESFGAPLETSFKEFFSAYTAEECKAAAAICMLYISYRKSGFPSDKLRSCICNIDENISKIYFNCNHYDKIMEYIPQEMLHYVPLYNSECSIEHATLTKEDILNAFDFYTNR